VATAAHWMMQTQTPILYHMTELTMSEVTAVRQMTVNEIIRRFPATVKIFNRFGIHACCGGAAPVDAAAVRDGADPAALMADLMRAIRESA
jgi:iron-sulfur cluster repair protein YtfE (RIC family)